MATAPQPQITGNPYSYGTIGTPSPNGINSAIGTPSPNGINSYSYNSPIPSGTITIKSAATFEVLRIKHADVDPVLILTGEENNQTIELQLCAEQNISAFEQHLISTFIISIMAGSKATPTTVMTYVRKHNLERHFKFTMK